MLSLTPEGDETSAGWNESGRSVRICFRKVVLLALAPSRGSKWRSSTEPVEVDLFLTFLKLFSTSLDSPQRFEGEKNGGKRINKSECANNPAESFYTKSVKENWRRMSAEWRQQRWLISRRECMYYEGKKWLDEKGGGFGEEGKRNKINDECRLRKRTKLSSFFTQLLKIAREK